MKIEKLLYITPESDVEDSLLIGLGLCWIPKRTGFPTYTCSLSEKNEILNRLDEIEKLIDEEKKSSGSSKH
jgi:hypothetical protein